MPLPFGPITHSRYISTELDGFIGTHGRNGRKVVALLWQNYGVRSGLTGKKGPRKSGVNIEGKKAGKSG
jgi:hypothetical protein